MKTLNHDALVAQLQRWAKNHSPHVKAAVTLLVEHDYWLRRTAFITAAVMPASDGVYIMWRKAREAFDAGEFDRASTSEHAVLDLAISLGEDRFKLTNMGQFHARIMAVAFAEALAVAVVR